MRHLSVWQALERRGISTQRIQILCSGGHIPGAVQADYAWAILGDAQKWKDTRIKSGKYILAMEGSPNG